MFLETLSDFFLFISTDQQTITSKNIIDFDIFISTKHSLFYTPPTTNTNNNSTNSTTNSTNLLIKPLNSLISDFLLFLYKHKVITLNNKYENQISAKVIELLKEKFPNERNLYQEHFKQNVHYIKLKDKETKKEILNLLRNNEINFVVAPDLFILFFNSTTQKNKKTVSKLMAKIRPIINDKNQARSADADITDDEEDKSKSDDKSNRNNKSGLSHFSEKDGLVQNKEKFLDVIGKVKNNLGKEKTITEDGKENENCDTINIEEIEVGLKEGSKDKLNKKNKNKNKKSHSVKKRKKENTKCECIIF